MGEILKCVDCKIDLFVSDLLSGRCLVLWVVEVYVFFE